MGVLGKIGARILGVDPDGVSPSPAVRGDGVDAAVLMDPSASFAEKVEAVLESVRPALHHDNGDIELIEVVGRSARVRLTGACDGCPSAGLTLRFGIEKRLKDAIPEFEDLIPV